MTAYDAADNGGRRYTYTYSTIDSVVRLTQVNAQGQQVYQKDQNGSIIETDFDTGGRATQRRVTTLGSGVDGAVRRIATTYTDRGQTLKVSQYDNATVGSGSLVDDVKYTYDDWGNIASFAQDPDSDLDSGASGVPSYTVSYTYTKATPTNGAVRIRRTGASYPGGSDLTYEYASGIGDTASRVSDVKVGSTVVATYTYLGAGQVGYTRLDEPNSYIYSGHDTSIYRMDAFNRITKSRFKGASANYLYDVDLSYDWDSNIVSVVDNINLDGSANRAFDAVYSMDKLSRLYEAKEGKWNGSSFTQVTRDEQWSDGSNSKIDQAGNFLRHRLDLNGNGTFTDAGDEDQTSDTTYNAVNETGSRTFKLSNVSTTYSYAYDGNGNQTDDGKDYTYVWDAFNRLKQVSTRGGSPALVAEYRYNGLNFRIATHYDVTDNGTKNQPNGIVNADDPWYYFGYTERWQMLGTRRGSDSSVKERFVNHNAGLGGRGSSSYIDDVILRDRDANTAWASAADGTLEERRYLCQNWRHDVSAVISDTGKVVETVKYSSYGVPFGMPAGDTDSNGTWDATDSALMAGGTSTSDPRIDANQDGVKDSADVTWANSITSSYQTLGRGIMSSSGVDNRKGYAGYELDPALVGSKEHNRFRTRNVDLTTWLQRDPTPRSLEASLYLYSSAQPVQRTDPMGLWGVPTVQMVPGSHSFRVFGDRAVDNSLVAVFTPSLPPMCSDPNDSIWFVGEVHAFERRTSCAGSTTATIGPLVFWEMWPMDLLLDISSFPYLFYRTVDELIWRAKITTSPGISTSYNEHFGRWYCRSEMVGFSWHAMQFEQPWDDTVIKTVGPSTRSRPLWWDPVTLGNAAYYGSQVQFSSCAGCFGSGTVFGNTSNSAFENTIQAGVLTASSFE